MNLPIEVEECLDVLQRRVLRKELREVEWLIARTEEDDLKQMLLLHKRLTDALSLEGAQGQQVRSEFCKEIANAQTKPAARK